MRGNKLVELSMDFRSILSALIKIYPVEHGLAMENGQCLKLYRSVPEDKEELVLQRLPVVLGNQE